MYADVPTPASEEAEYAVEPEFSFAAVVPAVAVAMVPGVL